MERMNRIDEIRKSLRVFENFWGVSLIVRDSKSLLEVGDFMRVSIFW
jgi:hypothetical protein